MTEFYIEYNPYTVECIFKKNGKVLGTNSKIGSKQHERLQRLLGESPFTNWKGLADEIADACDDDEVKLLFKGRRIDFDDLESAIRQYHGSVKFDLSFEEAKNDADVMGSLDKIFAEIEAKNLPAFKQKNAEGKNIFDAYRQVKNGIFEVSVIATMSSGKSTLINSILGTELLPSANEACTAAVVNILDNDDMDTYEAECFGADDQTVIYPRVTVDAERLAKLNRDERINRIDIEGNIPVVPSNKIRLCLVDTPGPNNAQDENHERLTYSIIRNRNSIVLYVMNATQMGINDDKQLLEAIAGEMSKAGKESHDRFVFVVNKCDELDEEKGETAEDVCIRARDYLRGFGILDPTVIPTSAKMALLIRKARHGEELTRREKRDLGAVDDFVDQELLHFEAAAVLTPTIREKLKEEAEQYHKNEDTWDLEALIHTGVPAVEQTIREYIDKYAYPIMVHDAVKDISAILRDLNMQYRFVVENARSESRLAETQRQIAEALKKHEESKKIYDEFTNRIAAFDMDYESERNVIKAVEGELGKKTLIYDGKDSIPEKEAYGLISHFMADLEAYQKNCEIKLRNYIENELFRKGNDMLKEYSNAVRRTLAGIYVQGYGFSERYAFRQFKIENLEDLQHRYEYEHYKLETRTRKNPKRYGWGFFKFWIPWKEEYSVPVLDGKVVDVKKIIVDTMTAFSANMKNNIGAMYAEAKEQIENYKDVFRNNLNELYGEIQQILNQLQKDTVNSEVLRKEVEKNKELAVWEAQTEQKIQDVLTF